MGQRAKQSSSPSSTAALSPLPKNINRLGLTAKGVATLFRTSEFFVLLFVYAVYDWTGTLHSTTCVDYGRDKGTSLETAKYVLTCNAFGHIVGRVGLSFASDKIPFSHCPLAAACLVASCLSFVSSSLVSSFTSFMVLNGLLGVSQGYVTCIRSVLISQYLGVQRLPAFFAFLGVFLIPMALTGPSILVPVSADFFTALAECHSAATTRCTVPAGTPAPDICLLNLRAARRRAQIVAVRSQSEEHWRVYNCIDAVAIDAVDAFLSGIGLTLAASKTEALLVHPRASTRFSTPRLSLRGLPIEWSKTVALPRSDNRQPSQLAARCRRPEEGKPQARVLYRAPVASLSACQLAALDTDHRNAVREYYALPHNSQVGPTLAEAGETPISLRITKTALNHGVAPEQHGARGSPGRPAPLSPSLISGAAAQHLLFPACRREHVKRALSALLDFVDGSGLRERL
ncbi:hypothetical protein HPB52_007177 [Rhipicephalus sanguineus]|uniref:Monocarboxylate transporter n=1 Tax=Rhipicephalus sanguineus TaxID=34632 RepID=A0A9D4Q5Z9_RHISA|nr:hypothetical protein HPB52_007177 [Rhipicephalus sanguineus]